MTLSEQVARWAAALDVLDRPVADAGRLHTLDTLGVALAALRLDTSDAILGHALELGGAPQATAMGLAGRLPAPSAAFVNGVLAHSLDYDDTHLPSILHPSASVVPAALAAAELANADGAHTLAAIVAGIEVTIALGMAGTMDGRSLFFERGQHATSICGAIGSAVAAAKLLAPGSIADAIGIAVSMGSGVIEGNRAGGTVKRAHCGIAAQAGVTAAMLARRGITGPPTALEGRFGFFHAWLDGRFDPSPIESIGETFQLPRVFFKPYPANHFTHAVIDAAIALRARGVRATDIERVTIGVAGPTVRTIGEPIEAKRAPESGYQAQFSAAFTFAAAFLGGGGLGLGLDDFTDTLAKDPARRAIAARVDVVADQRCDDIYPMQFPAVVTVMLAGGGQVVETVLANRGGTERPLTEEEVATKFRENVARVLPADAAEEILVRCMALDELGAAGDLLDRTREAKGSATERTEAR